MKKLYLSIIVAFVIILSFWFAFSTNRPVIIEARETQTIELKNGDTYDMVASYVNHIIDGKAQRMLAYNSSIPGPTIRVIQDAEVTINFKNNTDMPQLLHSHGVRMDNAFDGSQSVQKEIKPGESFAYKLKFPDVGVYWYHPHAHEVYGQALGLYGAFIVASKDQNYFPPVNQEIPLFLSDLPINNGKIDLKKDDATHSLMGHYGNVMLVNGKEDFIINANKGEIFRLYVINAANARPFKFAIKGLKMKLVGGDSGAYEKSAFVDSVTLGPSERAIIDVLVSNAGTYEMQNNTPEVTYSLGSIVVSDTPVTTSYKREFDTLQSNSATIASINPFRSYFNKTPDKRMTLTLDMTGGMMNMQGMDHGGHMMSNGTMMGGNMMSSSPDGIEWNDSNSMMNVMSDTSSTKWKIVDRDTGKENDDINWVFKKDQPVKIEIFNDPKSMHPMQHPIHFHGQRFLVIARNGVQQTNLVWKDTVLVKSGETVDIVLDPSNVGDWMAHCHISEHLVSGMMFEFKVE